MRPPHLLTWRSCHTVLLDMDGTLLDLSFDNWFWREAIPRCVARSRNAEAGAVREELFENYARRQGSLEWYCLDYWTSELGLDLRALKNAASHRIRYLAGAREFLDTAAGSGKRLVLVTNAHAHTLAVKKGVTGFGRYFECCVSAHEFGVPKEAAAFWPLLQERLGFDPSTTMFVDDSVAVLDAAAEFGIRQVVAVTRPDSRQPARTVDRHAAVESVAALP
jgi:putative hydrolase of the HAD superfamily